MKRTALVLLAGLILVTGCSNEPKDHNAQDVSFAQDMIPHHQQAVQMSDMALTRASSANVKDLARRIKAAQGPEIEQMKGWLSGWGAPVEAKDGGGMGGMNHGSGSSGSSDPRAWG